MAGRGTFIASVVAALGSSVTLAATIWGQVNDTNRYNLEVDRDKIRVVELIKEKETTFAQIILDYYQDKFDDDSSSYGKMLKSLQSYLDTVEGTISNKVETPDSNLPLKSFADTLTQDYIRNSFYSPERRRIAEQIAEIFDEEPSDGKDRIAQKLIAAKIQGDEDKQRRYRVNLYIALTFSLIKPNSISAEILNSLKEFRSDVEYSNDSTYRRNVENAIRRQGGT